MNQLDIPTVQISDPPRTPVFRRPPPPIMPRRRRFIRKEKIGPAFWTVASILSITVNLILVAVLVSLAGQVFSLKKLVNDQLIGGLYENFVLMDQARITTTVPVSTIVKAQFDIPYETDTTVRLTQDTVLQGAYVDINGGILEIHNAPTTILLPAGTDLPVHLNINVPVNQDIPVNLDVKVDIPLNQTDLHQPFVGLQEVVRPYHTLLNDTPDNWTDAFCGLSAKGVCSLFTKPEKSPSAILP